MRIANENIIQAAQRAQALEKEERRNQERLRIAAAEVVSEVAHNNRTVREANTFASITLAEANTQVSTAQADAASL